MKAQDAMKRLTSMEEEIKTIRAMISGEEPTFEAEVEAKDVLEEDEEEEQEEQEAKAPKKAAAIAMLKKKIGA